MPAKGILIVDDGTSVRRVLQMQLVEAGYTVDSADSGTEARSLLLESRPKLVITDLRMPGLNGIELLRLISEDEI
jgi:CheY-like chemotaxis protein